MVDKNLLLNFASEDIKSALVTILHGGVEDRVAHEIESVLDQVEALASNTSDALDGLVKQRDQMIDMVASVEVDLDNPFDAPHDSKVGMLVEILTEQIAESVLLDLGGVPLETENDS